MTIVLQNQVEASEKSAQALEKVGPEDLLRELESLTDLCCDTFEDMAKAVERWQDAHLPAATLDAAMSDLHKLYVRLDHVFARTAAMIELAEKGSGKGVIGRPQYFNTWRKLKAVVAFDPARVEAAFGQIDAGKGLSLGDVERELSRGS